MSDEPNKLCPFCGEQVEQHWGWIYGHKCVPDDEINWGVWQSRPIEDALTAQREQARNSELNALEAYRRIEIERDALREKLEVAMKAMDDVWRNTRDPLDIGIVQNAKAEIAKIGDAK